MIHYFHRCTAALIALTLGAATALAYDIKGKIVDSDGEPMVAATVKLLAAKDSTLSMVSRPISTATTASQE